MPLRVISVIRVITRCREDDIYAEVRVGAGVPWGSNRFGDSEATEQVERGADIGGHGQPILESQAAPRRGAPVSEPGRPHQPLVGG